MENTTTVNYVNEKLVEIEKIIIEKGYDFSSVKFHIINYGKGLFEYTFRVGYYRKENGKTEYLSVVEESRTLEECITRIFRKINNLPTQEEYTKAELVEKTRQLRDFATNLGISKDFFTKLIAEVERNAGMAITDKTENQDF